MSDEQKVETAAADGTETPATVEGIEPDADGVTTLPVIEEEQESEPTIGERRKARDVVASESDLSDPEIIARRSADIEAEEANEYRKVFVLPPGPKPTPANGYAHDANMAATRQYAIQAGLYPTGDVRHVSTKQHDNGVSWVLTYAVKVVPTERVLVSEPDVVLEGEDAPTNTDGAGHSADTSDKAAK